jgi:hypothetical protein
LRYGSRPLFDSGSRDSEVIRQSEIDAFQNPAVATVTFCRQTDFCANVGSLLLLTDASVRQIKDRDRATRIDDTELLTT